MRLDGYHVLRDRNKMDNKEANEGALLSHGIIKIKDQIYTNTLHNGA